MALKNKLGITDPAELARVEEKISKKKALELFETGKLDTFEVGTFAGLNKRMIAQRYALCPVMRLFYGGGYGKNDTGDYT